MANAMITVVHGFDRLDKSDIFQQMFAHRKHIFFDQKKWDVKIIDGLYEIDEFDRDDTEYVCSISSDGRLMGSVRLINTSLDHMAAGIFAPMFPGLSIRSPTIWEATRFAVPASAEVQQNNVSLPACEILLGMCQFGLDHGVSQMTAIYEAPMARVYRRCGLSNIVLGRHKTTKGSIEFGLWDISKKLESEIYAATGLKNPLRSVAA